jgi:hypothetical protein
MKKIIKEGFREDGTPDMKYYAFDWDDNIVHMPTKIIVKDDNGDEVKMSTDDFATYREQIGKEPFKYNGKKIVGYGDNPFRNFRTEGDEDFIIDAMKARTGPAFDDFREAINNGSIFAIITARGHNPKTLKNAIYNYIISGFNGIDSKSLIKNLKKYRDIVGEQDMNDDELIKYYLNLNKYHPVTFGSGSAANPEEAKVEAMESFIKYIKSVSSRLNKKAFFKNDISNNFIPTIGFSDDDIKNIDVMTKHFKDKPDKIRTYSTAGGIKREVE